jgi:hypothetical protein
MGEQGASAKRRGNFADTMVDEIEKMKALPEPTERKIGFDL